MLTTVFQAGLAAALDLLLGRIIARTFDNLLQDIAGEFVGAASRRLLRAFVDDVQFSRLQQRLADPVIDWFRRVFSDPSQEGDGNVPE